MAPVQGEFHPSFQSFAVQAHTHPINRTDSLFQEEPDTPITSNDEVTKMLETLVTDNEMLKRDGEELQRLLSESREEFRGLQEELDELRASENRKYSRHRSGSAKSSMQLPPLNLAPLSPRSIRSFSGAAGFTRIGKRAVSAERSQYVSPRHPFQFSILNQTFLFVRNPVPRPPLILGVGPRKSMPSPHRLDSYWS